MSTLDPNTYLNTFKGWIEQQIVVYERAALSVGNSKLKEPLRDQYNAMANVYRDVLAKYEEFEIVEENES